MWWQVFIAALAVFALAVVAMAVGVILRGRRLRGTCGGLAGLSDERGRPLCDACSDPSPECTSVEEGRSREQKQGTAKQNR